MGFGPGPAAIEGNNGYVGIFADPQHTQTCATIPPGNVGTLYLFALLTPESPEFTGAEFTIQVTNPTGYQFQYTAPAGTVTIGSVLDLTPNNPFDTSGLNIAYGSCRGPDPVPLGTLTVLNLNGGPTELQIKRRNGPANPASNCPLIVDCFPDYNQRCMTPCGVDATGGAIAARLGLNDPSCQSDHECPAACAGAPCVTLAAVASAHPCAGRPVTITATATNCSATPEDIDVYVAYGLAGSFTNVGPGQSVVASRTYTMPGCEIGSNDRPPVGAVLHNAACPEPTGREIALPLLCDPAFCAANHPPDCSNAHASIPLLWPPDGSLVSESIEGIADPDGDPLNYRVDVISTDEPAGTLGTPTCPDAFIDGPNAFRVRAERNLDGNGRVYLAFVIVADPSGAECTARVPVSVPRKPDIAAVGGGFQYDALSCNGIGTGNRRGAAGLEVVSLGDAGAEVRFHNPLESSAKLDVFDIRGRRVATLAGDRFAAGEHVLRWDGRDVRGVPAAAGIYLFRLETAGNVSTAKVVIVR
jgi:hypothetical protein